MAYKYISYKNTAAADWAKISIINPVNVKLRFDSLPVTIFLIAFSVFIAISLLALPVMFFGYSVWELIVSGWKNEILAILGCSGFFTTVIGAVLAFLFTYYRRMRGEMVKTFTNEEIETREHKKYRWENLLYINQVYTTTRRLRVIRNSFELVFENGKVIVPPLIKNQAEIFQLVDSIPADRKTELR